LTLSVSGAGLSAAAILVFAPTIVVLPGIAVATSALAPPATLGLMIIALMLALVVGGIAARRLAARLLGLELDGADRPEAGGNFTQISRQQSG